MQLPDSMRVFERGWLSSNNVLFFDPQGATLVDTGYYTHAEQTLALVSAALNEANLPLTRIVNSHLHSDHCGGNATLKSWFQSASIHIPATQLEVAMVWDARALSFDDTGQHCPRFHPTAGIRAGDALIMGELTWHAYGAPGHDADSLIFYCESHRLLISADALWENGCGVIFPELVAEPGFAPALATLDLIEQLQPEMVIPGHGAVFGGKVVPAAIERARTRLQYLAAEPERNAAHALRVLIKFKLLEQQRLTEPQLLAWAQQTPLFAQIAQRFFPNVSVKTLTLQSLARLVASGAAQQTADGISNPP